ncbi:MAG TPA: SRPBCC domain-containing protein [Methylomirabilota bacterium]|jgi:carbon monoxide dehydrogenase subunit G
MPRFEEHFRLPVPRSQVWTFLQDYARVAPCMPGCESVTAIDADRFRARVSVKVGPVHTTQELSLTVTERRAPERLASTARGEDSRLGSRVAVESAIELREAEPDAATDVSCVVDLRLTGPLATLGEAVMRAKSGQMVKAFAERLRAAIEQETR